MQTNWNPKVAERELGYLAERLLAGLMTPNELDRNGEPANLVDGLFAIARALDRIAAALRDAP